MAFLKFEDIDKSFGENNVISKFNLDVEKGKFIVLLGPSGCGKSTLLRMIAGLEKIDYGKILLENNLLNNLLPSKRQIAMVFQSYALYPHMDVFQNISFGLKSENNSPSIFFIIQTYLSFLFSSFIFSKSFPLIDLKIFGIVGFNQ